MSTEQQKAEARSDALAAPEIEEERPGRTGWLLYLLKHPLILLVAGALLTNYLIPSWTRQWQDRQAELEIQVALVNAIDQAVTEMIMSVQFAVLGSASQSQSGYDQAYRQWEVDRHMIHSKLQAYYPEGQVVRDWEALSTAVTDFYAASGTQDAEERQAYLETWVERKERLFQAKAELNQQILNTPVRAFR